MAGFLGDQNAYGTQSFGTTYLDPKLVQQLSEALGNMATGNMQQLQSYISNPTASPLFQNSLSGLMNALAPMEKQAQTNLSDQFRGMGNMSSGQYGVAGANLQGDLLRNRQTLASQLLAQQFPQMVNALQSPISMIPNLLQALKERQGTMGAGGAGARASSGGGGVPFLDQPFSDPWAQLGLQNPASNPQYNMQPGQVGVNSPQGAAAGAPVSDPWARLNELLGGGGGGSDRIWFDPQRGWTNWDPTSLWGGGGQQDQFQPWTGSLLTQPQPDVASGSEY